MKKIKNPNRRHSFARSSLDSVNVNFYKEHLDPKYNFNHKNLMNQNNTSKIDKFLYKYYPEHFKQEDKPHKQEDKPNKQKVLIFPEGKRSFDGELEPLKQGAALMALKNNCPIIPCWIDGAIKTWPRKKKLPHLFGKITVHFGEEVKVSEKEDVRDNLKQIMEELELKMRALRPR